MLRITRHAKFVMSARYAAPEFVTQMHVLVHQRVLAFECSLSVRVMAFQAGVSVGALKPERRRPPSRSAIGIRNYR
jgi:hypothetical protein